MPTEPQKKTTFDAVLAPAQYPAGKQQVERLIALKAEFGPVLGSRLVHSRYVAGNKALLTGDPLDHQFHAADHPRAGQEIYAWVDRGDGVLYGLKDPDAPPAGPAGEAKSAADTLADRRAAAFARRDALAAVPPKDRTHDQADELAKLERFLPVMYPDAGPAARPSPLNPNPAKV